MFIIPHKGTPRRCQFGFCNKLSMILEAPPEI